MAMDVGRVVGTAVGRTAREVVKGRISGRRSGGALSGGKGLAAGVGLAVLAPLAGKAAVGAGKSLAQRGTENVSETVKGKVGESVKDAVTPGGGKSGEPGVGKG